MKALLDILPSQQRRLWPELSQIPKYFVLYGGTAIALRLGSRQSIDFDFFTERPLSADALLRDLPFLAGARLLQAEPNTATFSVRREGEIKVSFFGSLSFGRIGIPERKRRITWISTRCFRPGSLCRWRLRRRRAFTASSIHSFR
jgi:hypothetical protein